MYIFDHKKRIKRLQESLKIAGTGTAVVVLPSNIRYLTGFWGYAARAEYFEPRRLICLVVSIGVVTGPLIGSQKGPLPLVASGQRA